MPSAIQKVRFVILAAPRTGSNMLASLLHSHPAILCHHELYNPRGIFYALDLRQTAFSFNGIDLKKRDLEPLNFLHEIWQHDLGHSHVGFKMTHYQNPAIFNALIDDKNIFKIVLKRKNKIATHVSKLIAEQNDTWEYYGEKPLLKYIRQVQVNIKELQKDIDFNTHFYQEIENRLQQNNQIAFHLDYESINSQNVQSALLNFLGCHESELKTKSHKQNPAPLSELIINYKELLTQLQGNALMPNLL